MRFPNYKINVEWVSFIGKWSLSLIEPELGLEACL